MHATAPDPATPPRLLTRAEILALPDAPIGLRACDLPAPDLDVRALGPLLDPAGVGAAFRAQLAHLGAVHRALAADVGALQRVSDQAAQFRRQLGAITAPPSPVSLAFFA